MKVRLMILFLTVGLLLSGCNWPDGSYLSVSPHREQEETPRMDAMEASDYSQLLIAMEELVASGSETGTIHLTQYPAKAVETGLVAAINYAKQIDPIGAYAVEDIQYELGTSAGRQAAAVTITYRVDPAKIQYIRSVADVEAADAVIAESLERFQTSVVMLVERYEDTDFAEFVQNYALTNPQIVMETPQITENTYGGGRSRVVELTFTYQNSREDLRKMHAQVEPVFSAATLYVSGSGLQRQKYAQLYGFLMERFDYTIETSITPAYSLLCHGVGDSRAFAMVYAAMCRAAGLECRIVTGTCSGEPRTWNMIQENGYDYHVDLLRCNELGGYRQFVDSEMTGYVWDYSAYPVCVGEPVAEKTEDSQDQQPSSGTEEATEPTQSLLPTETTEETGATQATEPSEPTEESAEEA